MIVEIAYCVYYVCSIAAVFAHYRWSDDPIPEENALLAVVLAPIIGPLLLAGLAWEKSFGRNK